jgi:hypothetical protein
MNDAPSGWGPATKQSDVQKDVARQYQQHLDDDNKCQRRESERAQEDHCKEQPSHHDSNEQRILLLPLTTSLPILNLIDMTAVALVVPLLIQYYKAAGITNASQRELLSSLFSLSQIVGGLIWGALSDAGWLQRKTLLLLSFGGSAISYLMIATTSSNSGTSSGGLVTLMVSRMLIGLVKQTMTVTTSMLTQCTTTKNRATHVGRYVWITADFSNLWKMCDGLFTH